MFFFKHLIVEMSILWGHLFFFYLHAAISYFVSLLFVPAFDHFLLYKQDRACNFEVLLIDANGTYYLIKICYCNCNLNCHVQWDFTSWIIGRLWAKVMEYGICCICKNIFLSLIFVICCLVEFVCIWYITHFVWEI